VVLHPLSLLLPKSFCGDAKGATCDSWFHSCKALKKTLCIYFAYSLYSSAALIGLLWINRTMITHVLPSVTACNDVEQPNDCVSKPKA
jgi:hypothetical protein